MRTRWYACFKAIFEYILAGPGALSRSVMSRSGKQSFSVTLLSAWKLTHRWRLPSFFFMKRTGAPHGDLLGRMKPFHVCSSRNSQRAVNSGGDKEYIGP